MHFVLVHGAWHDGRCWSDVAGRLRRSGHTVSTPTLSGMGPRSAELTRDIGLSTHVQDVIDHLTALSHDVILVGHSYAGLVVREAADRVPDKVLRLVLVEGWAARNGESMASIAPAWFLPAIRQPAQDRGDGWRIPPPPPAAFGVDDDDTADRLAQLVSDHPLKTFLDPTTLSGRVTSIPCTAIVGRPGPVPFAQWAQSFGWPVIRIDSGHDLMLTAGNELADALDAVGSMKR